MHQALKGIVFVLKHMMHLIYVKTGAYVLTLSNCMWYLLIDSDAAGFHLIPDI